MKTIWMFNHYATGPDEPKTRGYDMGRLLVKNGHKMVIFASSFSHYKLEEKYLKDSEKYKIEDINGVKFVWIKSFSYKKNDWRRSLNMIGFAFWAYKISKKINERPDIVIGTTVHPFAALAGYFASRSKKSRFFLEITDLWPEIMIDMKFIKRNSIKAIFLRVIEKFLFDRAEKIITIPPNIDKYIKERGVKKEKIIFIPNGIDLEFYKDMPEYGGGEEEKLVAMYSGIFSNYAGLDTIISAAKILQDKNNDKIKIILLGGGAEKHKLMDLAKSYNLSNLQFCDMVPRDRVLEEYKKADVFISLVKNVVASAGLSSKKVNDYLASGRPIIFAVNSINNPVSDAGAGLTTAPENPDAIAGALIQMAEMSAEKRKELGKNAKEYAKNNLDIKVLTQKLEQLF